MGNFGSGLNLDTHMVVSESGAEFTEAEVRDSIHEESSDGGSLYVLEERPMMLKVEFGGKEYIRWVTPPDYGIYISSNPKQIRCLKVGRVKTRDTPAQRRSRTVAKEIVERGEVIPFPKRTGKAGISA